MAYLQGSLILAVQRREASVRLTSCLAKNKLKYLKPKDSAGSFQ